MTDTEWEAANTEFLTVAMTRLRERLTTLGDRHQHDTGDPPVFGPHPTDPPEDAWWPEPAPALITLADRLGLSAFETNVVLLCAATELDTGLGARCAHAAGDPHQSYPTFALAMQLFPADAAWEALSPWSRLRRLRLLEVDHTAGRALVSSPLHADERIVNYLKGLNELDHRLEPYLRRVTTSEAGEPPASHRDIAADLLARWSARSPGEAVPLIELVGAPGAAKRLVAQLVSAALGCELLAVRSSALEAPGFDVESFLVLWERERALLPVALLVEAPATGTDPSGGDTPGLAASQRRIVERAGGLVLVSVREPCPFPDRGGVRGEVAPASPGERAAAWAQALPAGLDPELGDTLAGQFELEPAEIRHVVRAASASGSGPRTRLWRECVAATRPALDSLAQRLSPAAGWDDLVLPAEERALLGQITERVRHRATVYRDWGFGDRHDRGLAVNALFAGPSGTGKTTAAEVLAGDLGLDLYRIDLSAVVSKYIGETEKNLRRLFDAADAGGAVLFFDEADALFGKRSEVRDSHDRYANIEVSYLLQRIETYRGLALLATNQRTALDPAFLRRIGFVVTFSPPDLEHRRIMWERVFPPATPTSGLDLDALARMPATGAVIRNIAVHAAFSAAANGGVVTMAHLAAAAAVEFRKINQPAPELARKVGPPR